MERSTFKVDTQLLVNSEGRQVFVPVSLLALKLKPVNEVIGLEYQPPAPGYSSSGKSKKRLPWEAQKVNLDHYYMVTDKPEGQQIFAHATAICRHKKDGASPLGEDIVQHSMDDQFFFEDTLKGQETLYARRDPRVQVFSLSTAEIGFVNATCLLFFPHYKVAKSFKWDTADRSQVENKVGDTFTIGQRSWIMSWTPEGTSKSTPHLCTFGRNMITRYSGVVPMDKLVELEPHELERWRNQIPAWSLATDQHHTSACCKHREGACLADRGPDIVEQMRHEKAVKEREDAQAWNHFLF